MAAPCDEYRSFLAQQLGLHNSIMVLRVTQSNKSSYVHIESEKQAPLTIPAAQNQLPATATMSANTKSLPAEGGLSPSATPSQEQSTDAHGQFTAAVDDLLDQLQHKFDTVSREMFGKFDDMARRLDELETSLSIVGDDAAGAGATATPSSGAK
ncbi:heat shock factor binding protein 1-domain-containing protein [Aspergillus pseudoustus]|uniref:Heat shock factor binding protein 1-domain-containing protein n=1 Tax=Aspergillus pseudoustus TaxID=1810923 RepID=A0ABR4JGN3_9EURO